MINSAELCLFLPGVLLGGEAWNERWPWTTHMTQWQYVQSMPSPPLPLVLFIYFGWPDHAPELKEGHFGIIRQGKHNPVL